MRVILYYYFSCLCRSIFCYFPVSAQTVPQDGWVFHEYQNYFYANLFRKIIIMLSLCLPFSEIYEYKYVNLL